MIEEYVNKPRCVILAEYMLANGTTVRNCASVFGISKSTVHKDITERLKDTDFYLYEETKLLLDKNKAERHLRGGEATRIKYMNKSKGGYSL